MLKLNIENNSYFVYEYTRTGFGHAVCFNGPIVIEDDNWPMFLGNVIQNEKTTYLKLNISTNGCTYECNLTCFDAIGESWHSSDGLSRIAQSYDFRVSMFYDNCVHDDFSIELYPARGFAHGWAKSRAWFINPDEEHDVLSPEILHLEYFKQNARTWNPIFPGLDFKISKPIESRALYLNKVRHGVEVVIPLTATLT